MYSVIFWYILEKYYENEKKIKLARKIGDFYVSIIRQMSTNKYPLHGQNIHKCGAKWSFNPINIPHFGKKVLKLVSPLFVGVYLAEHYEDLSTQFFNITNLIHG